MIAFQTVTDIDCLRYMIIVFVSVRRQYNRVLFFLINISYLINI